MRRLYSFLAITTLFLLSACNLFLPVDPLPPAVSEVNLVQVLTNGATVSATIQDPDAKNSRQEKKSGKITEYGFVYATQEKPTVEDGTAIKVGDAVTTSPFQFQTQITGLNVQTTYYIATYAKNEGGGVGYGAVTSFKTDNYVFPTLTIGLLSNLTKVSADVTVSVASLGTTSISSLGVCYSTTNTTPTTSDNKVEISNNVTVGDFKATISGLSAGTTYYARSYAVTSGGIAYSRAVLTFTLGEPAAYTSKKSFTMYYSNPYDLDLGELVSRFGAEDLNWYPANDVAGIYPKNGAQFAVLGKVNFDKVLYAEVAKAVKTADFINGNYTNEATNKLATGTVLAYITNQGRFGKMIIDAQGEDRPVGGSSGGDMQVTILTYEK